MHKSKQSLGGDNTAIVSKGRCLIGRVTLSQFCYFSLASFLLVLLLSCGEKNGPIISQRQQLNTPTYDGSGQGMHPDIVSFTSDWHNFRYWMSVTPYPNNNSTVENPSILASHDGMHWEVPPGINNPVASYQSSHLMDSDLFYDAASDQLWLYYARDASQDYLERTTSSDGVHWSAGEVLLQVPYVNLVSPAVQKVNGTYELWSVNPGASGCGATTTLVEYRTSPDGEHWTAPSTTHLQQPGAQIWHMDVVWIESKKEYWTLFVAYPNGKNCGTTSLYFAKSTDGLNWTSFSKPVLSPGPDWDAGQIYRSTFLYDPSSDSLDIWYSARDKAHAWHTGWVQAEYSRLIQSIR
jgi:hypothetical protein